MGVTTEQILSIARINSFATGDPAIGRDDVHQEICLALLKREPENFAHAVVAARSAASDVYRSKQCRRRRQCDHFAAAWGAVVQSDCEDAAAVRELQVAIGMLSRFQAAALGAMLSGRTPQEFATVSGASVSSVFNAIKRGINVLRSANGLPELKSLRLGHCRTSDDDISQDARFCRICNVSLVGYRVDATVCRSYSCRNRSKRKRQKRNCSHQCSVDRTASSQTQMEGN